MHTAPTTPKGMKTIKSILAAIGAIALSACSSSDESIVDVTDPVEEATTIALSPAKASEVEYRSNKMSLSSMRSAAVVAPVSYQSCTGYFDDVEEVNLLKDKLTETSNNTDLIDTDFIFCAKDSDLNVELYIMYGWSGSNHSFGLYYYDDNNEVVKIPIEPWQNVRTYNSNGTADYSTKSNPAIAKASYKGISLSVKKGYKFGFYWNGNNGTYQNYWATTYYSSAALNAAENGGDCSPRAGIFEINGRTYLGIEDWIDNDFQDCIIMCPTLLPTVESDQTTPAASTETTEIDATDDPVETEVKQYGGSVEVNFALNDEHENGDWIDGHLSIHVRDTTDITLTIPVEAEYYVPADDMAIVMNHEHENMQLNEQQESFSMTIAGQQVVMTITHKADAIVLQTSGINATVMRALRETFNDGLTFEVRTHFNDALTRAQLQEKLNQSTISFQNSPAVYVRANGYSNKAAQTVDQWACSVLPADIAERETPTEPIVSRGGESELWLYPRK